MAKESNWGTFEPLPDVEPQRLIMRSYGPQKTGKNHFGFTMPDPIAGLYFDPGGIEGVAKKFARGEVDGVPKKDIRIKTFRFSKDMGRSTAIEVRDEFEEQYAIALKRARSIQIDESELWQVYRWAEFDGDSDAPKEYGPLYTRYRNLIQDAVDNDVNLQFIQKVKERWENVKKQTRDGTVKTVGQPTGEMEPYGMKEVPYLVQMNIRHSWEKARGFIVTVEDCRQNMELAQEEFENTTFPDLAQLVFPDSAEEDWV